MNATAFLTAGSLVGFFAIALATGPESRAPWLIATLLCFAGIFIFDEGRKIVANWGNSVVFSLIFGLTLKGVLEPTPQDFWRDISGAVFLIAFLFEHNAEPWAGRVLSRSTVTPAIFFFVLVLGQNIPALGPEEVLLFSLLAIATLSFMEVFNLFREKSEMGGTIFVSACRSAVTGLACAFYTATFLPGIARQAPFDQLLIVIPSVGLMAALVSLLFRDRINRYLLFCCGWSLFVFWAALGGESDRFLAAVGASIAGSWSIMTTRHHLQSGEPRRFFLNILGWGAPGSLMFSLLLYGLLPSGQNNIQAGAGIWLASFFIYWTGLMLPDSESGSKNQKWDWRGSLALSLTLLGGAVLGGVKLLPELLPVLIGAAK